MADRTSKTNFINTSNTKIMAFNSFKEAIMTLQTIVLKYDGKKMDKRFIDKVNKMFEEKGIEVKFSFDTNYRGERDQKFKFYFSGEEFVDSNNNRGYLNYDNRCMWLYPNYEETTKREYMNTDFKLDAQAFLLALHKAFAVCEERTNKLKDAIENADEVIKTYAQLNKIITDTMKTIPEELRAYNPTIYCPIYDTK